MEQKQPLDPKALRLQQMNERIEKKFGKAREPWGWGKKLLVGGLMVGVVGSGIYYLKNQKETPAPTPQKTEQVVPVDTPKVVQPKPKKIKKKSVKPVVKPTTQQP